MEALTRPLDAIRKRVQRQLALRRASPATDVDPAALKRFWSSLSPAVRREVLHFQDAALVRTVHSHMFALLKADMWRQMNGAGDDEVGRLTGFEFEVPAERTCMGSLQDPFAIVATPEFANEKDLLGLLADTLGSEILSGRPALQKPDWLTVFADTPSSWSELQEQVFRLVELAIFHAERDPYFQLLAESRSHEDTGKRRVAKKREKKKHAPAVCAEETADDTEVIAISMPDKLEEVHQPAVKQEEDKEEVCDQSSTDGDEPRSREVAQSRPLEATCFEWLPDLFNDKEASEFRLMQYSQGSVSRSPSPEVVVARAYVKNTFMEVEVFDQPNKKPVRRRSALF
mmetsp:Transcript_53544/g.96076  ORF Transcript_53544/g.96076 Transcript_53544/m.96076 type:complete len:343 (-) Transcript_53544:377-1405(-)|eukprot:CAMPEP_0197630382 /NCGR_PEP_ID=MMETSP1338-20131121/7889_1 /TAXON_ID=43686 ORGANISM="Pelagodinium beii, Strain RCC1491" /NCGR_SAMPLE_ID=MMETSP1338 /ASSEMBLY_ACC=CAM_ASM_000754 /LENGTH=342 /DNA_ID=CAMNT_0043201593 /DNA_START=1 /DNA_END=1029 /DNA_ORIENTATION=+